MEHVSTQEQPPHLRILTRSEHPISRRDISPEALKVLYRLHRLGFRAYLVGGGVRDLFLQRRPKDFDIATDARPNRLRKVFRNCRVIGRRFRLVHVVFPGDITVEVSTFRCRPEFAEREESGLIVSDNSYGTPEDDARRRDLTINGLFYDIATFSILDYVGGVQDLRDGIVRTIAPPEESFREDPVRMIRAIRQAARLGFTIHQETYDSILRNRDLLGQVNESRLSEEIFRDLRGGAAEPFMGILLETGLMHCLFPDLATQLAADPHHILWQRLRAVDSLTGEGRELSNAVLMTVLWHSLILPPELAAAHGRAGADMGRLVYRAIKTLRARFRLSLQASSRMVEIIMAVRRLGAMVPNKGLPHGLRGKSYARETLEFMEICELAGERATAHFPELYVEAARFAPPPGRLRGGGDRGPEELAEGEEPQEPRGPGRHRRSRRRRHGPRPPRAE